MDKNYQEARRKWREQPNLPDLLEEVWKTLCDICEFHDESAFSLDLPGVRELMQKVGYAKEIYSGSVSFSLTPEQLRQLVDYAESKKVSEVRFRSDGLVSFFHNENIIYEESFKIVWEKCDV